MVSKSVQITAGLLFYAFPYILLLVGASIMTVMQTQAAEMDNEWLFFKHPKTLGAFAVTYVGQLSRFFLATFTCSSSRYLLVSFGIAAACEKLLLKFQSMLWAGYMLAPLCLVLVFQTTKFSTAPEKTSRQLRHIWRA